MSAISDRLADMETAGESLGAALSEESVGADGAGYQEFQAGYVTSDASGNSYVVDGVLHARYLDLGGPSMLGLPVALDDADKGRVLSLMGNDGNRMQLIQPPDQDWAAALYEPLVSKYGEVGGPSGVGWPTGDHTGLGTGSWAGFGSFDSAIYVDSAGSAFLVWGPINVSYWTDWSGPEGLLGWPIGDQAEDGQGGYRTAFENGTLHADSEGVLTSEAAGSTPGGGGGATAASPDALTSAVDVDGWFRAHTNSDFVDWFNANHAGKGHFAALRITGADAKTHFANLWNRAPSIFDAASFNLESFLGLMCIVLNETGGSLVPTFERVGSNGHPGIAYAFDTFQLTGSGGHSFTKASYNTNPNRTAGALFRDDAFMDAHSSLAFASQLRGTVDPVWDGKAYPQSSFPTSTDSAVSGVILECDFYKFRGRGFIQSTWRSAYAKLVEFVQTTTDSNATLAAYTTAWAGHDVQAVLNASTNDDWNTLFLNTDYVVAAHAVRSHNLGGNNYMTLSSDRAVLTGTGRGSAHHEGKTVSGSGGYGDILKARLLQMRDSLPR